MAGNKWSVETEKLTASAQIIEDKTARYNAQYQKIYSEIADLRITWQGQSSDTFNQQLEGYRNDFQELENILKKYAEFLRATAANIEKAEDSINSAASSLNVGR